MIGKIITVIIGMIFSNITGILSLATYTFTVGVIIYKINVAMFMFIFIYHPPYHPCVI